MGHILRDLGELDRAESHIRKAIKLRNYIDTKRKISPLRIPPGAVIVETTKINKKQMFGQIERIVKHR